MKKLCLGAALALAALLAIPLAANAAEYNTFVGCDDLSEAPVPSHVCQIGDYPGAYFEADVDTEYEVCVDFPSFGEVCTEEEEFAEGEVLYVNSIFTELTGNHLVTWYVKGVEVGSWLFRMDPAPAPPAAPPPPPPPPAPLAVTPPTSTACLRARLRVKALQHQLSNSSDKVRRARLRARLKAARTHMRATC